MKFKIILQVYPGHSVSKENNYLLLTHQGKTLLEYTLENLLRHFKPQDIIAFCFSQLLDTPHLKTRLEKYSVEIRSVSPGEITRSIIQYISSTPIDYAVRVIGNNPFLNCQIIQDSLKRLEAEPFDYVTFVNAPTGFTPSEIIGQSAIFQLHEDADFNQYLKISRDLNIVSFLKRHPTLHKLIYDSQCSQYQHHDLSISHPTDLNHLQSYLGSPMDLKKYDGQYTPKIIFAHIEPTNLCNLDCLMCPRKTRKKFGQLSFEQFQHILDKMVFLRRINLNGDGEPFLNPHLPHMLELAKQKNIMTRCITNATIPLKEAPLVKILAHLDFFNISLDGSSASTFEKIRKNGHFHNTLENIKHITQMIQKHKLQFDEFWINFVIQKENFMEIESMVQLVAQLGIPAINFKLMNSNYDRGSDTSHQNPDSLKESLKESMHSNNYDDIHYIQETIQRATQTGKTLGVQVFLENDNKSGFSYPACGLDKKVFITFDGYVTPCCLRTEPEVFNFGNILTQTYDAIFGSSAYRQFIQSLLNNFPPGLCLRCPAMETFKKSEPIKRHQEP